MAAFNFPDPTLETTVVNPITGSTYQWKEPPGKWVMTTKLRDVSNIIWEGDDEPNPNPGDYKLWYHTEELELYYWYEDVNGVGAWLPTSTPITAIEDLDNSLFQLQQDVLEINAVVNENVDRIERTIWFGDTPPTIYPDDIVPNQNIDADGNITPILDEDGNPTFIVTKSPLNYPFWLNTDSGKLYVLLPDPDRPEGYSYTPIDTDNGLTLREVCENGNISGVPIAVETERGVSVFSDQELRITHEDNPYIRLVDQSDGDAIEITLNDDHGHIDLSDINDELHFKFGQIEKVVFKGTGAAEFKGPVSVGFDEFDPQESHAVPFGYYDGAQGEQNDAIKDLQDSVVLLQQEIEELSQTQDAGTWLFNSSTTVPRQGQFCLSAGNGNPSTTWKLSTSVAVNGTDIGMEEHNFNTWEEDDTIEIFSADTGTFALYTLGAGDGLGGFFLKEMQRSKGVPVNNVVYEIRIFKLEAGLNQQDADDRYVNKSGDTINGQLNFIHPSRTIQTWFDFKNSEKANQISEIRVQRPYDADGGVNADGTTNNKGTGGLDVKLMANSDGTRLRILGGSGGNNETVVISGGGSGKQVTVNSSIRLGGGSDEKQVIYAKTGVAGHLSYGNNNDAARRLSWGDNKVWIRNATLDMGSSQIINCADPDPARKHDVANVDFVLKQIEEALQGASFDNYVKKDGDTMVGNYDMTTATSNGFRILGNMKVKKTGQTLGGNNNFYVDGDEATYEGRTTGTFNLINKDHLNVYHYTRTQQDNRYTQGKFKITNSGGNFYIEPS